tara:strand:+ start:8776 stop:9333 length:558 start_codon:yes stop_codon:yes gene_type:complete
LEKIRPFVKFFNTLTEINFSKIIILEVYLMYTQARQENIMKKYLMAFVVALSFTSLSCIAAEHKVKMLNNGADGSMVFEPAVLKVAVGDTVTFLPTNPGHNSVSVSGMIPNGAKSWAGNLNKEISVKIEKEGVYVYQCTPHVVLAMVGVIVAGNPTNLDAVKKAATKMNFVMNKERLSGYLAKAK